MGDHVVGGRDKAPSADQPRHEAADLHVDAELLRKRHGLPGRDVPETDEEGPRAPDVGGVAAQAGIVKRRAIGSDD